MNKQLYDSRKSSGLCVMCGCTLPEGWAKVRCDDCTVRMRENAKKRRQAHAAEVKANKSEEVTKEILSLDDATVVARNNGLSYAEMQKAELIRKMREEGL